VRFLFVHQNFPGQYLHILQRLVALGHEVVFISQPNANRIPGVRVAYYDKMPLVDDRVLPALREAEPALRRAIQAANVARNLKQLGFTPDIIIGHHGWGELLNMVDVFPGIPILGYFEFYYHVEGQDVNFDPEFPTDDSHYPNVRALNMINLLALALGQHGQTPTNWQLTRYPEWARPSIKLLPEGADLNRCRPDQAAHNTTLALGPFRITPKDKLVTFVARNLEPYRGFHVLMRALPDILKRRDVKVVMVGGDDVSYGARIANSTWREHFQRELEGRYDASRVLMPGQVDYNTYLKFLQRSDAHVYLTYPFVLSWSLREAMATGCAVIGADVEAVREVVTDGKTGLLTPCLDPTALAKNVLHVLEDTNLASKLRTGARRYAEKHLDLEAHLTTFMARITELTGQNPTAPPKRAPRRAKA
jgi:glycosyltransferase involved in cell wall biosynthesis